MRFVIAIIFSISFILACTQSSARFWDPTDIGGIGPVHNGDISTALVNEKSILFAAASSEHTTIPLNASIGSGITNKLTVTFWFKAADQASLGLIGHWNFGASNNRKWAIFTTAAGDSIRVFLSNAGTAAEKDFELSVGDVMDSAWHHFAAVYDGTEPQTDELKLYHNGVQDTTPVKTVDNLVTTLFNSARNFGYGALDEAGALPCD